MNIDELKGHFRKLGTDLQVTVHDRPFGTPPRWRRRRARVTAPAETRYVLNVQENGRKSEQFTLDLWPSKIDRLEFVTADLRPDMQHLLLMVKRFSNEDNIVSKDKFLCGHDERHWFIATIPEAHGVANVPDAMEVLKPRTVIQSQRRNKVRAKDWHNRRNAGFIRQGEWFFLPMPNFQPHDVGLVLHNEPLRRPFGKAHIVEEIFRIGGETVYVCHKFRAGLSEAQYNKVIQQNPKASKWNWRIMRRNPQVYARGKVRHPDHKTIVLPFWHRVAMANERGTTAGGRPATVAFLD